MAPVPKSPQPATKEARIEAVVDEFVETLANSRGTEDKILERNMRTQQDMRYGVAVMDMHHRGLPPSGEPLNMLVEEKQKLWEAMDKHFGPDQEPSSLRLEALSTIAQNRKLDIFVPDTNFAHEQMTRDQFRAAIKPLIEERLKDDIDAHMKEWDEYREKNYANYKKNHSAEVRRNDEATNWKNFLESDAGKHYFDESKREDERQDYIRNLTMKAYVAWDMSYEGVQDAVNKGLVADYNQVIAKDEKFQANVNALGKLGQEKRELVKDFETFDKFQEEHAKGGDFAKKVDELDSRIREQVKKTQEDLVQNGHRKEFYTPAVLTKYAVETTGVYTEYDKEVKNEKTVLAHQFHQLTQDLKEANALPKPQEKKQEAEQEKEAAPSASANPKTLFARLAEMAKDPSYKSSITYEGGANAHLPQVSPAPGRTGPTV